MLLVEAAIEQIYVRCKPKRLLCTMLYPIVFLTTPHAEARHVIVNSFETQVAPNRFEASQIKH